MSRSPANALAEQVYARLKSDIFDFRMLPGERFTETAMAELYEVSRTPMRDALYRLQREGYLEVEFRRGWQVRNLDFVYFDNLYDLRIVLETAALDRICQLDPMPPALEELVAIWLVAEADREAMSKLFLQHPVKYLYVVDAGNRYLGVVPLAALGSAPTETSAGALLSQAILPITADTGLGEALQRFLDHLGERLPLIESASNPVLLGVVAKSALLATYVRLSEA